MEHDANKRSDDLKKIPSLDLLINAIDRQVDALPSPYADVAFAVSFSSRADALKKLGQPYIRFELGGIYFALPLQNATEIDYIPEITPLPNLPKWVVGICHLRGDIVSVVDLKMVMQFKPARGSAPRKLIIVRNRDLSTAIMVDDVAGMRYAEDQEAGGDKRSVENRALSKFVDRIIESEDRLVHLLDVNELMKALKL